MVFIRLACAEFKAMFFKVPKILAGMAVVIAAVVTLSLIITGYSQTKNNYKNTIAISVPDDTFTNIAVTAVENMDSVSEICRFVRVNDKEAEAMVKDNRASAALIFEDNFVQDIISGKNIQPRIIVSQNSNKLFMELAGCGSSMLAIVQAGVYSAQKAYAEQTGNAVTGSVNRELNMEYINTVFSRETYFENINNSGITISEYYVSMLFCVFLLLLSMSFSQIVFPQSKAFYSYTGLSYMSVAFIQFLKIFTIYFVILLLTKLICNIADINLCFNILAVVSLSAIVTAIYSVSGISVNGSLFILFFAVVFGYVGGCFLPPSFMPEFIRDIMEYTPINITGSQLMGGKHILYSIAIWLICAAIIIIGGRRK